MVRNTHQGMQEAKKCKEIRERLWEDGYDIPLIADIRGAGGHDGGRVLRQDLVNPGNFADGRKKFEDILYETDEEYNAEIEEIEKIFTPLVLKCKERGSPCDRHQPRILSARTLSRYGVPPRAWSSPRSSLPHLPQHDYHNFVFSMKASNRW